MEKDYEKNMRAQESEMKNEKRGERGEDKRLWKEAIGQKCDKENNIE